MKIGIIGDSPALTTGFGITTKHIAKGLSDAGHEVVCFGLKGEEQAFDPRQFSFRIWPASVQSDWAALLSTFLENEKVDAIVINMDIFNLKEVLTYLSSANWHGPIILYVIFDGIPAYKEYLEMLTSIDVFLVTTNAGARYLKECGIPEVRLAPPGVDPEVFQSLPNTESLRREAGLHGKFVVGVFGRNTERKQQTRVLAALSHLKEIGKDDDVVVYFHCQTRAYWHLDEIAHALGVENNVIFAADLEDETAGVPYTPEDNVSASNSSLSQRTKPMMPSHYSYVERINCCDLILNVAHCGDFEQVLIEAQSCGVPLAATNDQGIMAEAMGDGGILLEPVDITFWKAGQRCFLVSIEAIAKAILSVKADASLRADLRIKGFENARQYPWERLKVATIEAIATLDVQD